MGVVVVGAALCAGPALAADAVPVSIPVGDWLTAGLEFVREVLVPALFAGAIWLGKRISPAVGAYVASMRTAAVEQLLQRAVDYGIGMVKGAVKDKHLDLNTGSAVLNEALGYAVRQGPGALVKWAGGPEALQRMIVARLHLAQEVSAESLGVPKLS